MAVLDDSYLEADQSSVTLKLLSQIILKFKCSHTRILIRSHVV